MSRRRVGAALTAGLASVVLTSCTSDEPAADPGEGESSGASASTTPAEPLEFGSSRGRVVLTCFPDGPRRIVHVDQVRASREVVLTGVTGGGDATVIRRGWVAPLGSGAVPRAGNVDLDAPGGGLDDLEEWSDRRPLEGAVLEPGQQYTWFVRTTTLPDRSFDDFRLAWEDAATSGLSTYDHQGHTRRGGC